MEIVYFLQMNKNSYLWRIKVKSLLWKVLLGVLIISNILDINIGKMNQVHAANSREEVVRVAASQVGYHEKASLENLDDFTANSGDKNYTKYARDLCVANGYGWGASFVWWVMRNACAPIGAYPDRVTATRDFFVEKGQWKDREGYIPKPGDYVCFENVSNCGIVESATTDTVTVIGGNRGTSNAVTREVISLDDPIILGYGLIDYDYKRQPIAENFGDVFCGFITKSDCGKIIHNTDEDVVLMDSLGSLKDEWAFFRQEDGSYIIKSLADGKVLEVENSDAVNCANVNVGIENGGDNQKWFISSTTWDYHLIPAHATSFSLDSIHSEDNQNGYSMKIYYEGGGNTKAYVIRKSLEDIFIANTYVKEMTVGDKQTLSYTLSPADMTANKIVWTSSNTDVADVDENGVVTAKTPGEVTISCNANYAEAISDKVSIRIREKEQSTTEATTEATTEMPTEMPTEQPTEATTEVSTEQPTEATTEVSTETATESKPEITIKKGSKISDKYFNYEITSIKSKTVKITAIKSKKKTTVVIPEKVKYKNKTYKITSISKNVLKNNKKITKLVISNNVKSIGDKAFYGCSNLKTVTIGKNVTSIGEKSFYGCKKLRKIYIKSTKLKKVGKNAFKKLEKKPIIYAPRKKIKAYQRLFKGKI